LQIKNNQIWAIFVDGDASVTVVETDVSTWDEIQQQLPEGFSIDEDTILVPPNGTWRQL